LLVFEDSMRGPAVQSVVALTLAFLSRSCRRTLAFLSSCYRSDGSGSATAEVSPLVPEQAPIAAHRKPVSTVALPSSASTYLLSLVLLMQSLQSYARGDGTGSMDDDELNCLLTCHI